MWVRVPTWRVKPRRLEHPLSARLKRARILFHRSTSMADVTIPFTVPTSRKDGSALPVDQIAQVDFELSADNGQTWTNVGHRAGTDSSITLQSIDVGQYLVRDYVTDTQVPPLTSDFSPVVGFEVKAPPLAAPNFAAIGTPVVT
jgi:hypothetical protein